MRLFTSCSINFLFILLLSFCQASGQDNKKVYVCPPCACAAHENNQIFEHDGECPHCGLNLIEKTDSSQINQVNIHTGSGNFLLEGGATHKEKTITVFYHKPKNFSKQSLVMMVIPGSGRNGWDYRDAWIQASEKYGLLILSPHYSEENYFEFWSYNLGGMIFDVKINEERTAMLSYEINKDPKDWIWDDFDRIFNKVKNKLELKTETYDMFGHSAGGQVLHRLTLFNPDNKANRILASNSGWYTIPTAHDKFPYGLKGSMAIDEQIEKAFRSNLVIFLGEEDDENETNGHLVRSPETDKQGTHRLARGKYFYKKASEYATKLETEFNWELKIIPNVGHDHELMSEAASEYLYEVND